MKKIVPVCLLCCIFFSAAAQTKIVADCTVTFSISNKDEANSNPGSSVKTLYIKGKLTRSDISGPSYTQTTIYDNNTGVATILREIGANKYMSVFDSVKWKEQNKQYEELRLTFTSDTKTILGYECKKAIAQLKSGGMLELYYAIAIAPSAIENPYEYKNVPGFLLEYETIAEGNTKKIRYTATSINFNPVPASKFEIPKTGYRML